MKIEKKKIIIGYTFYILRIQNVNTKILTKLHIVVFTALSSLLCQGFEVVYCSVNFLVQQ